MNEYTILLAWDDESSKWYALNDDIPIIKNGAPGFAGATIKV
jgi:hypothetical protein